MCDFTSASIKVSFANLCKIQWGVKVFNAINSHNKIKGWAGKRTQAQFSWMCHWLCIYKIIYQKLSKRKLKFFSWLVGLFIGFVFWIFFLLHSHFLTIHGHTATWCSYILNKSSAGSDQLPANLLPWPSFLFPRNELTSCTHGSLSRTFASQELLSKKKRKSLFCVQKRRCWQA